MIHLLRTIGELGGAIVGLYCAYMLFVGVLWLLAIVASALAGAVVRVVRH